MPRIALTASTDRLRSVVTTAATVANDAAWSDRRRCRGPRMIQIWFGRRFSHILALCGLGLAVAAEFNPPVGERCRSTVGFRTYDGKSKPGYSNIRLNASLGITFSSGRCCERSSVWKIPQPCRFLKLYVMLDHAATAWTVWVCRAAAPRNMVVLAQHLCPIPTVLR